NGCTIAAAVRWGRSMPCPVAGRCGSMVMTCMSQRASAAMMAAGVAAMAAAAGLASPARAQDSVYLGANIDGRQVPSGGEDGAPADFNAAIDLEKGEICYYLAVLELPDAEAASINHAKAGESGPAVATLPLPQ